MDVNSWNDVILLSMPTLEQRRNIVKLITMYKILTGSLDVPSNDFSLNQCPSREGYFNQPQTMIEFIQIFFFCFSNALEHTSPKCN